MFSKLFGRRDRPHSQEGAFFDGAYRLHRSGDVGRFTDLARTAFPDFADRIECFGADWLGRQFARDHGRHQDGQPLVLMLEPGTGEVLEIPADYTSFHENELLEQAEAVAALSFYERWRSAGGARPRYDQCIGYKVPLFLGGLDDLPNLEVSDLDVYWTLASQLLAQIRETPSGTVIDRATLE